MNNLVSQIHEADVEIYTKIINLVKEAISDNVVIALSYKDLEGNPSVREIEPLEIKKNGGIFAWCLTKNAVRHFKISSIVDIKKTAKKFEKRVFEKKVREDEIA